MNGIPLTAREARPEGTLVRVGSAQFGGKRLGVIAGPCAVEDEDQVVSTAKMVKAAGAVLLRGGAYKPRTSPYQFQGLKEEGLRLLAVAKAETGMGVVTEVMDARHLEKVGEVADMFQVGSRNMQNFTLLDEVGRLRKPVLLKRGMMATLEEFLMAAERVAAGGNRDIVLCERGIRTFEVATRNTLDLNAVAFLKRRTHLPVIVDPSHGTGHWWMVPHMARGAVAVGADGLIVEVHVRPEAALCDGFQSLSPSTFERLMRECKAVAEAVGREW
jgi:3-deoxy-7-phosphoheptulonate synthase